MTPRGTPSEHHGDRVLQWLRSCQGFRLEANGRRIGIVEDILYGDGPEPAALVICAGLLGRSTAIVPVDDVVRVLPRTKRIVVRGEKPRRPLG